jgi:hypothetical protein
METEVELVVLVTVVGALKVGSVSKSHSLRANTPAETPWKAVTVKAIVEEVTGSVCTVMEVLDDPPKELAFTVTVSPKV